MGLVFVRAVARVDDFIDEAVGLGLLCSHDVVAFDIGSDLKSGSQVLGDPAQARGKPGQGYGYGAGIAMHTPVGPIRFEYAVSEKGAGRMHCGLARSF